MLTQDQQQKCDNSMLHSAASDNDNNDSVLSMRQYSLLPHDVSRRRNNAVSSLYKTAMKKRSSAAIVSIETFCEGYKPTLDKKASQADWAPALNLTVCHEPPNRRSITPISHYEHNMNQSVAAGGFTTIRDSRPLVHNRSSDYVNRIMAEKSKGATGNDCCKSENKSATQDLGTQQKNSSESKCKDCGAIDAHELLCEEILSALNGDIFDDDFAFDNKWTEDASNATDVASLCMARRFSRTFSRPRSMALHDRQEDSETQNVSKSKRRLSDSQSRNSRFQLKLDNLRLRCQSDQDICGRCTDGECSPEITSRRFWSNNADLKTKIISESVNRELKHVARRSLHATSSGEKTLTAILKRISSEHSLDRSRISVALEENLHAQPTIDCVSNPRSDKFLSDFLQKTLDERNPDASFKEQLSVTLPDQELQCCILRGRDNSRNLWMEFEKLEFA